MIMPTGGTDKVSEVQINKIYKINAAVPTGKTSAADSATISKFSALVEKGRTYALSQPEVRNDKVSQAKQLLENGTLPQATDIASMMINSAAEGQV